jgi:hypothetical protein
VGSALPQEIASKPSVYFTDHDKTKREGIVNLSGSSNMPTSLAPEVIAKAELEVLNEVSFARAISLERMRTQRSGKPVLLMLLDIRRQLSEEDPAAAGKVLVALTSSTRETDVTGWYKTGSVVGVLFTEIVPDQRKLLLRTLLARVSKTLGNYLNPEQFDQIATSFHFFPESQGDETAIPENSPISVPLPRLVPLTTGESSAL